MYGVSESCFNTAVNIMHIIERNYNDFWTLKYVDLDNGDQNVNVGIIVLTVNCGELCRKFGKFSFYVRTRITT